MSPAQTRGYCAALQTSGCSFLARRKNTEAGPTIVCPLSDQASPLFLRQQAWRGKGGKPWSGVCVCGGVSSRVTLLTQPPRGAPWSAASLGPQPRLSCDCPPGIWAQSFLIWSWDSLAGPRKPSGGKPLECVLCLWQGREGGQYFQILTC